MIDRILSTLKAPITTAADHKIMIIHENRCQQTILMNITPNLKLVFLEKQQHFKLLSAANYRLRFMG